MSGIWAAICIVQSILNGWDNKGTDFADNKNLHERQCISDWKVTTGHHNTY